MTNDDEATKLSKIPRNNMLSSITLIYIHRYLIYRLEIDIVGVLARIQEAWKMGMCSINNMTKEVNKLKPMSRQDRLCRESGISIECP